MLKLTKLNYNEFIFMDKNDKVVLHVKRNEEHIITVITNTVLEIDHLNIGWDGVMYWLRRNSSRTTSDYYKSKQYLLKIIEGYSVLKNVSVVQRLIARLEKTVKNRDCSYCSMFSEKHYCTRSSNKSCAEIVRQEDEQIVEMINILKYLEELGDNYAN